MKMTNIALVVIVFVLNACISTQTKFLNQEEMERAEKIGTVNQSFLSFQPVHIKVNKSVQQKAYAKLMAEARSKYNGNIDVVNITIEGSFTPLELLFTYPFFLFGNLQKITATGDVILTNMSGISSRIDRISVQITETFKGDQNITVAILDFYNIDGKQSILGRYLAEQTSNYLFQNSRLKIVERSQINRLATELDFGSSGYVSEESAVQIGNMLGANAVVLGSMTKIGNRISVNIKIVDVRTGSLLSSGTTEISGNEYLGMYDQIIK